MDEKVKTVNIGSALADYIVGMDYGTVIHYQEIENITRERRRTQRYYNAIAKAKTILLKDGKMIKCIGGGDYQVIYPGDYSGEYVREVRIARNHVKQGGKILKNAPVNDMTTEERQKFNNVSDFHSRLEASVHGQFVEVKRLAKKNPLVAADI